MEKTNCLTNDLTANQPAFISLSKQHERHFTFSQLNTNAYLATVSDFNIRKTFKLHAVGPRERKS